MVSALELDCHGTGLSLAGIVALCFWTLFSMLFIIRESRCKFIYEKKSLLLSKLASLLGRQKLSSCKQTISLTVPGCERVRIRFSSQGFSKIGQGQ